MYHNTSRGVRSIIILDSQQTNFTFPKDYNYFEGFMPNVTVPDNSDTTYWCYSFAVPTFENPVHIFRAETIVQEGHESLVHHLLVYSCRSMNMNWSSNCFSPNMPTDLRNCDRLVYGWAIGAEPLNFPEHVGISLGKENDPTVYFIELHYDNPGLSPDFHDNSGVRFYYTSTLRQYEAGVWQFGELVSPFQAIPPKEQLFKTFGICYGDCTRQALDVNINGFFVFLHSHLAGRQMKLQHYRNGHLIEDVGRDDNYDFNLQDARVLQPERVFKPGDDFVVTCGYNTADRDSITKGGLGTKDEMCVAYIYYYPKQSNAGACQSVPDLNEFNSAFNIECDTAECIYARLSEMDPTLVREGLHNVSYNGKRNNYCRDLDYNNIPGVEFYKDFPAWFGENDRIEDQNDVCSPTGVTGSSISIMPPGSIMLIMLFLARTVILTMK
ncbi:DBH-like monooxygenase protein 1 isoform X2 [Antedon mediterranea]